MMGHATMVDKNEAFCVVDCNGRTIEISDSFSDITDYSVEEFLGKDFSKICSILRISPGINFDNINKQAEYFLFTKSLEIKFMHIKSFQVSQSILYVFSEIPNSRLDIKFPFADKLCSDNHNGIAIFSVPEVILLKANEKFISFFDEPYNRRENCIGKRIDEFITGFKGSTSEQIWKTVLATGETYNISEYMYDRFERGVTYWKSSLTPIFENGELKYCIQMTTEITDEVLNRKRIDEQNQIITQQKELLETVIDSLDVGVHVSDKNGKYLITNKESRRQMYNYDSIDALGQVGNFTTYCDTEGNEIPYEQMPGIRALRGERVLNKKLWLKRPDKDMYLDSSAIPLFNSEGKLVNVVACCRDITDTVEKEKKIKQQKALMEAIVDNLQEAVYVNNSKSDILVMNKVAIECWNKQFDKIEYICNHIECYYPDGTPFPKEETATARAMRGLHTRNNIAYYKKNGKKFYSIVNGAPVYDNHGNILYSITTTNDITDFMESQQSLKEANEKLLLAEQEKNEALEKALEMKDEFLSIISHEFRTPLNVINTAIQAINSICKDELSDRTKEYIKMIKQNALRQMRLVNNLLDITRANLGGTKIKKKNVDIVKLTKSITESVNAYAADKGIGVTFVSTMGKKIIGIDDEKYERILLNLISNAIKFSAANKLVIVKLSNGKDNICIEVIDNGIGIPEDKIDLIFERFGQVDSSLSRYAEGAGIGLSLVKKLVCALGGSISVKSKVSKGSTFTVILPNEKVIEDCTDKPRVELLNNRLIEITNIEFSDIYL